jgi:hypothetical protein
LRGKDLAVLSSGSDMNLKEGFHMPFIENAKYLGMNYLGNVHSRIEDNKIPSEVIQNIDDFIDKTLLNEIITS